MLESESSHIFSDAATMLSLRIFVYKGNTEIDLFDFSWGGGEKITRLGVRVKPWNLVGVRVRARVRKS